MAALSRARAGRRLSLPAAVTVAFTVVIAVGAGFEGRFAGGVSDFIGAGLLILVPVAIVVEFRRELTVTPQSVLAALCIYVVLGMIFASVASGVSAVTSAPYFANQATANSSDYTYFSFITLATVGYGDLVPALRLGRALAVLEGLMGQLYLVTVVALLVANLRLARRTSS
jgi:nucleoside permease NupC